MLNTPEVAVINTSNAKRAAVSGFLGSALEYYDFMIYGTAAALVFGTVFFSEANQASTIISIGSFGVAYIARPFGAIFWGHIGDRFGRRISMICTIASMGAATFLIGCVPATSEIGILAPIVLVVLRLVQGLSAGGESPGAVSLTVEHSPDRRRAFFASFSMGGLQAGIALGSLVFIPITAVLSTSQLHAWGWRIPFLLSGIFTIVAYFFRRKLQEPDALKEEGESASKVPIVELLKSHWFTTLRVTLCSTNNIVTSIFNIYILAYATASGAASASFMLAVIVSGNLVAALMAPLFGALSDAVGRKPIFIVGSLGGGASIFLVLAALDSGSLSLLFVSGIVSVGIFGIMPVAVASAFYPECFVSNVRYTGVAISLMLGVLVAGFAPSIGESMTVATGSPWPVAWMCLGVGVTSSLSALTLPETYRVPRAWLGK